jgi:hypothetical protein
LLPGNPAGLVEMNDGKTVGLQLTQFTNTFTLGGQQASPLCSCTIDWVT